MMYGNFQHLENITKNCRKCNLCKTRKNVVFGAGNVNAKIMLIAEAPGKEEDKVGLPFVGASGKVVDYALEKIGLTRDEIYISNIVKCNPPGNRNPSEEECNICLDYLRNQVILIKPKIIILLGSIPLKKIIGENHYISKERGTFIEQKGILYMPTWHPSAVLRDRTKINDFVNDFEKAMIKLKEL